MPQPPTGPLPLAIPAETMGVLGPSAGLLDVDIIGKFFGNLPPNAVVGMRQQCTNRTGTNQHRTITVHTDSAGGVREAFTDAEAVTQNRELVDKQSRYFSSTGVERHTHERSLGPQTLCEVFESSAVTGEEHVTEMTKGIDQGPTGISRFNNDWKSVVERTGSTPISGPFPPQTGFMTPPPSSRSGIMPLQAVVPKPMNMGRPQSTLLSGASPSPAFNTALSRIAAIGAPASGTASPAFPYTASPAFAQTPSPSFVARAPSPAGRAPSPGNRAPSPGPSRSSRRSLGARGGSFVPPSMPAHPLAVSSRARSASPASFVACAPGSRSATPVTTRCGTAPAPMKAKVLGTIPGSVYPSPASVKQARPGGDDATGWGNDLAKQRQANLIECLRSMKER